MEDIFEKLAHTLKPIETTYKKVTGQIKDRVVGLSFETTIDKIIVILEISGYQTGGVITSTDVIIIEHNDFQEWLQENEKMQIDLGEFEDPTTFYLSYAEYMMEHVDKETIALYLVSQDLVSDGYIWTSPKPSKTSTV